MTSDPRIDRLEVAVDGLKSEVQNLRNDMNARFSSLEDSVNSRFSEVNSRINTLLVVNIGLWVTTIGTLIGFFVTR